MSTFTSNSRTFTPTSLSPQQDYDAFMGPLLPNADVLVMLARALSHRALRFSQLVSDQAAVVEQVNTDMGELHDIMSMFNTALSQGSSAQDTDALTLYGSNTRSDVDAKAALVNKWLDKDYAWVDQVGSAWSLKMRKEDITSSNQNLQLDVDDKTSESQAQQTRAQSFMNKYSSVIEAASSSQKKATDLMLGIIASLASTG